MQLRAENPNLFKKIDDENKVEKVEKIGGDDAQKKRNRIKYNLIESGAINAVASVGRGFATQFITSIVNDYVEDYETLKIESFTQYLTKKGVPSQEIDSILNIMFSDEIIDKKNLKISENYKKIIEASQLVDEYRKIVTNYLALQLNIFGRAIKKGLSGLIHNAAQGFLDGVTVGIEEQKLLEQWANEHNERKLNARYADKIDIQDWANMKSINIIVTDENNNILKTFNSNDPNAATISIVYDYEQQHFSSAEENQDNKSVGDCFFKAIGEVDPHAAKKQLYQWRTENPDKAFQNVMVAELININNDFKGYGQKQNQKKENNVDPILQKAREEEKNKHENDDAWVYENDYRITEEVLKSIPQIEKLFKYYTPQEVIQLMNENGITSQSQIAHFFGQLVVENQYFKCLNELPNNNKKIEYGLPLDKSSDQAYFNRAYSNNEQLGNIDENDGYKYRGWGDIQLTGRWNFEWMSKKLEIPELFTNPEKFRIDNLENRRLAFKASIIWYTKLKKQLVDNSKKGVFFFRVERQTEIVNGSQKHGLENRYKNTLEIYNILQKQNGQRNHCFICKSKNFVADIYKRFKYKIILQPKKQTQIQSETKRIHNIKQKTITKNNKNQGKKKTEIIKKISTNKKQSASIKSTSKMKQSDPKFANTAKK